MFRFKNLFLSCCFCLGLLSLQMNAQQTLILQPGPQDGWDTPIGYYPPLNYSDMNFSFMTQLLSKALIVGGDCSIARSLIRFDLSVIPANATIHAALLSLYVDSTGVNPTHIGANSSYLRRVVSTWSNTSVTWNTKPATTLLNEVILAQSSFPTQDYENIDITAMVAYMVANPQNNFGMELGLLNETCQRVLTFCSSKHSDAHRRPKLVVQYSIQTIGQSELALAQQLHIYPNPCQGKLFIRTETKALKFELFDLSSRLIYSLMLEENTNEIDTKDIPAGVYISKIHAGNGQSFCNKLVIQ